MLGKPTPIFPVGIEDRAAPRSQKIAHQRKQDVCDLCASFQQAVVDVWRTAALAG